MSFANYITREIRAFDPELGKIGGELAGEFSSETRRLLYGAAGSSPYLATLMGKHAEWLSWAFTQDPDQVLPQLLAALDPQSQNLMRDLRIAKGRVALFTGLADLAGVWPLEKVTTALTQLADRALDVALQQLVAADIRRKFLPDRTDADVPSAAGMVVLAMGKMGAFELNSSSDIDLICLFDASQYDPDVHNEVRSRFIKITRMVTKIMQENTADGYVFRTDLRLRPDASVTPVCLAMEVAERYYESVGRTWERAAFIKARACAGDIAAGEKFLQRMAPFVWRRHLDFAAVQDANDMRGRIRDHKGLNGAIVLENHNMKLGHGGIREIEFFTQTRQLIARGRDASLRSRETVAGLHALAQKGWINADEATRLTDHYRAHREIEHRLQVIRDAQTHNLPKSAEEFERLACLTGHDTAQDLRLDLMDRLEKVATLTEPFFAPKHDDAAMTISPEMAERTERWLAMPALRSDRATQIFQRLRPLILQRLERADDPNEAMGHFETFLHGLPAGVQLFSLFDSNTQLLDLFVDICTTSHGLAQYLSQNASVLDSVLDGGFFEPWPDVASLQKQLTRQLGRAKDYELMLDAARRWRKDWHFRIGVHHLRGLITANDAASQYADLAEAILGALWPFVADQFAQRHGDQPGKGAAVIAMGSLGAGRLNAQSDLDLIVVYDADGADASDGPRPLSVRPYYARLTQAFITAITAPTGEGRLYEVDMRLRPSGRQGPVATSLLGFQSYQMDEAWTWEHLALTRARAVAGTIEVGQGVERIRTDVLKVKSTGETVIADVQDMRRRLAEAKPARNQWDGKSGAGRMMDIELVAQTGAVLAASTESLTQSQLQVGVGTGLISEENAMELAKTYELLSKVNAFSRLLAIDDLDVNTLGQGAQEFLMRETGEQSMQDLGANLLEKTVRVAKIIDQALDERL